MWNPVNAFLGLSPFKRVILVVLVMLVFSVAITGYEIYSYVYQLGHDDLFQGPSSANNGRVKNPNHPGVERIAGFLADCDDLDRIATETWGMLAGSSPVGLSTERQRDLEKILTRCTSRSIEDLLVYGMLNFPGESFPNFRSYRERVNFIASNTLFMKRNDPGYDLMRPMLALQRQHLFVESHPSLISRLVGAVGMSVEDRMLHTLLERNAVSPEEAGKVLDLLDKTDRFRPTFRETMFAESRFVERAYYRVTAAAPVGSWILDSIYGDPLAQMRDLASRSETLTFSELNDQMQNFGLSSPRTHLLVVLMFPNVVKARERLKEKQALHAIVLTQLSARAGITRVALDPYGVEPLRSLMKEGRTVHYSVGPNGKDDGMTGDDVTFAAEPRK